MRKIIGSSLLVFLFAITNLFNVSVYGFSAEKDVIKSKLIETNLSKEKEIKIKR